MAAVSQTVTLHSGLQLSYAEKGQRSDPAVVLLPGPTDSWVSYRPVLDRMPESIWTLAVSLRGHGDSSKPDHGYRVEDFASDVADLLDAVGIGRAILVGHSGSCLVARRVAIERPDRTAGLVLEASPATLADDPALTEFVDAVVSRLEDPIDPAFARSFVVDTSAPDLPPHLLDQLVAELMKVPAPVWREMFSGLLAYDDVADLPRISAPALLVWGEADPLVGRDMQEQLLDRIPKATLVAYPGIGHTPRWEAPSRFATDVIGFARDRGSTLPG